jgi:hypothetical protein
LEGNTGTNRCQKKLTDKTKQFARGARFVMSKDREGQEMTKEIASMKKFAQDTIEQDSACYDMLLEQPPV